MDEMREIVTIEQMDRLFLLLAIAAPILGAVIGAAIGRKKGRAHQVYCVVIGLMVGLLGPLNLVLWKVYNAITNRLGLDSVKNLLVNLTLFAALGIGAGLAVGYMARKRGSDPDVGMSPLGAGIGGPTPVGVGYSRRPEESDEHPRDA
jgi:cation transporter-like permease